MQLLFSLRDSQLHPGSQTGLPSRPISVALQIAAAPQEKQSGSVQSGSRVLIQTIRLCAKRHKNHKTKKETKMKLENIKFSLQTTKNPLYFQLSFPLSEAKAAEAKLSHGGRAFTVLSKSEVKALCGEGYKPFALANVEADLREQDNQDPTRPTLLKFDLLAVEFRGGMGDWNDILEAAPAPEQPTDNPKGF